MIYLGECSSGSVVSVVTEPEDPKEAGVGLMFVASSSPVKGWAVKNIVGSSPADVSVEIKEDSLPLSLTLQFKVSRYLALL